MLTNFSKRRLAILGVYVLMLPGITEGVKDLRIEVDGMNLIFKGENNQPVAYQHNNGDVAWRVGNASFLFLDDRIIVRNAGDFSSLDIWAKNLKVVFEANDDGEQFTLDKLSVRSNSFYNWGILFTSTTDIRANAVVNGGFWSTDLSDTFEGKVGKINKTVNKDAKTGFFNYGYFYAGTATATAMESHNNNNLTCGAFEQKGSNKKFYADAGAASIDKIEGTEEIHLNLDTAATADIKNINTDYEVDDTLSNGSELVYKIKKKSQNAEAEEPNSSNASKATSAPSFIEEISADAYEHCKTYTFNDLSTKPVGLPNVGLHCYALATLQMLYTSHNFRKVIENKATPLCSALNSLFSKMGSGAPTSNDLNEVYKNARQSGRHGAEGIVWSNSGEQDAQEFLGAILDKVSEETKVNISRVTLQKSIDGKFRSNDPANVLQLSLNSDKGTSIPELVVELESPNKVEDQESPEYGKYCKENLINLPDTLFVQLERFETKGTGETYSRSKTQKEVSLSKFITIKDKTYALKAIVVHKGNIIGGHYVSYVVRNNGWWLCDDSSVNQVATNSIQNDDNHSIHMTFAGDSYDAPHDGYLFLYEKI